MKSEKVDTFIDQIMEDFRIPNRYILKMNSNHWKYTMRSKLTYLVDTSSDALGAQLILAQSNLVIEAHCEPSPIQFH